MRDYYLYTWCIPVASQVAERLKTEEVGKVLFESFSKKFLKKNAEKCHFI